MRSFPVQITQNSWGRTPSGIELPEARFINVEPIPPSKSFDMKRFLTDSAKGFIVEHIETPHVYDCIRTSVFFDTLKFCYANHHALALYPEVLGHLVYSTVAEWVKANPDTYRHLFTVLPEGKDTIEIDNPTLRLGERSAWGSTISRFDEELRQRVPSGVMDLMLPNFSTHTPVSRVAALITFMDAASPFYDYRVRTMCGIPRIDVHGTTDDWKLLLASVEGLKTEFPDLGHYFHGVLSALTMIVAELEAEIPNNEWWASIYKNPGGSGNDAISGWIRFFIGHVTTSSGPQFRADTKRDIQHSDAPTYISTVPFVWNYFGTLYDCKFMGGMMDVRVEKGALAPRLSFAVLRKA